MLLFCMIINKAFTRLYILGNNIYTRSNFLANIYLLLVTNGNTSKRCEICSKLTMKTPERLSTFFIVSFEHISHLFLVFSLLTLNK